MWFNVFEAKISRTGVQGSIRRNRRSGSVWDNLEIKVGNMSLRLLSLMLVFTVACGGEDPVDVSPPEEIEEECEKTAGGIELCDGVDNDCDGEVDEDYPELGQVCGLEAGATEQGVYICGEDQVSVVCNAEVIPDLPDEVCDGIDNDLDGEIDEEFPGLGDLCSLGSGSCVSTGTYICSTDGTGFVCDAQVPECPPETPVLSVSVEDIKTFRFEWQADPLVTGYRLFETLEGGVETELAVIEADQTMYSYYTFLPERVNAQYVLEACNDFACAVSDPVSLGNTINQAIGYVKSSNSGEGDLFGYYIALSNDGSTMAVSSHLEDSGSVGINGEEDNNDAISSGAVYVFVRENGNWVQEAYIKASNPDPQDRFGISVGLSDDGNTLAVGANGESSSSRGVNGSQADNSRDGSGAAYVFVRDHGIWSQEAYIKASNPDSEDEFGGSVALSGDGNTLAVGAIDESSSASTVNGNSMLNDLDSNGAVYIFVRESQFWNQTAYIKPSLARSSQWFGASVSLSTNGDTLAVGAPSLLSNEGSTFIFVRTNNSWEEQAHIRPFYSGDDDKFGVSVSLSGDGNTVAVGAFFESSDSNGINGDQTNDLANKSGAAYIFERVGTSWNEETYIKASNSDATDQFGSVVALSKDGNRLVVGSINEDGVGKGLGGDPSDNSLEGSGAAYLFTRIAGSWTESSYMKAGNSDSWDRFGAGVAISGDGQTIAVGAPSEDGSGTGFTGVQTDNALGTSGAVYLY